MTDWLSSHHLRRTPEGAAALAKLERLDPAVRRCVVAAGNRLASYSATLAQRYLVAAVGAAEALRERFEEWQRTVEELLAQGGSGPHLIEAFLGLDPIQLWTAAPAARAVWLEASKELAGRSRRIGTAFLRSTGHLLSTAPAASPALIEGIGAAANKIEQSSGWRGETLAVEFIETVARAGPGLNAGSLDPLARMAVALGGCGRVPHCLRVPPTLATLAAEEQRHTVELSQKQAERNAPKGEALLAAISDALSRLDRPLRPLLLSIADRIWAEDGAVATFRVLPAVCHELPAEELGELLAIAREVAGVLPAAAIAYLRAMDRARERSDLRGIHRWAEAGIKIASRSPEAAVAHFSLRSRTSHKLLAARTAAVSFEEVEPVLERLGRMLARGRLHLNPAPGIWLRPPILPGDERAVVVPERVDLWPESEDNQRFYKLIVAHAAGRWEYGTYGLRIAELRRQGIPLPDATPADGNLAAFLESFPNPLLAAGLFVLLDGIRIDAALARDFPGLALEARRLGRSYAERLPARASERSGERLLEALFLASVSAGEVPALGRLRPYLALARQALARLSQPEASVVDSVRWTVSLYGLLAWASARADDGSEPPAIVQLGGATFVDEGAAIGSQAPGGPSGEAPSVLPDGAPNPSSVPLEVGDPQEEPGGGLPISPAELKRLIEQGLQLRLSQAEGRQLAALGLFVTDLLGKMPRAAAEQLREALERGDETGLRAWIARQRQARFHLYDEWDYRIGDYRHQWCRVEELEVDGDGGRTFRQMLAGAGDLIARLKREFLLMRPEQFRRIRGMEDGREFDLNAVVDARVDLLRRKTPSDRLYVDRRREERDVATLFLIDMSASTDEPLPGGNRRVIDLTKETLVVMSSVLEEIGDAYAIYGFSGYGRLGVEVYRIKSFRERLGPTVRGRLGAIEPRRSTRMGAALRHAATKFAGVSARSRHVILISDGFPQDFDYGDDRTSNVYGIRDTTKALEELERSGVRTFCITIDPAGHDYLREMCPASRYAVIDDVARLPEELPRIYRTVVARA